MDVFGSQTAMLDTAGELARRFIAFVPNLLGAIVLLLLGWLAARLSRGFVSRLVRVVLERASRSKAVSGALERTRLEKTVPALTGALAYWIVLLFFGAGAVERLELTVASDLVSRLAFYLPNVLLGLLVILAGILAGNIAYSAINKASLSAGFTQGALVGRAVEVVIILVSLIIGADQIGIESTLFTVILATAVASVLGATALAFGLGSRGAVGNLISTHYLMRLYSIGQTIRIAGIEGRIVEFTQSGVILETAEGRVLVPGQMFNEESSLLVVREE